jgi:hypothetical protein
MPYFFKLFQFFFTSLDVLNALKKVTDSLHRRFPSTPVLPVLGNHDAAPAHQLPDRPSELYYRIFNLWENAGWLGDGQKVEKTKAWKPHVHVIPKKVQIFEAFGYPRMALFVPQFGKTSAKLKLVKARQLV